MELVCIALMTCFETWCLIVRLDCDASDVVLLLANFDSQHSFITAKSQVGKLEQA